MTTQETARQTLSHILSSYAKREEAPYSAYAHFCQAMRLLDKLAGRYEPANEMERLIMDEVAEYNAALQVKEDA